METILCCTARNVSSFLQRSEDRPSGEYFHEVYSLLNKPTHDVVGHLSYLKFDGYQLLRATSMW